MIGKETLIWGNMTVKADARLRGWAPPAWRVAPGTLAELIEAVPVLVERGRFCERRLRATFRVTYPNGAEVIEEVGLSPAGHSYLYRIDDLALYLQACEALERARPVGEEFEDWKDQLELEALQSLRGDDSEGEARTIRVSDGAELPIARFLQALELMKSWEDLKAKAAAGESIAATDAVSLVDWAYFCGWFVRDAEVPGDLQRSAGIKAGQKRSDEARAWWPPGAAWAQELWEAFPVGWSDGRRKSMNGLASEMYDRWSVRPFQPVGPARVDHADLVKRIIPAWKREGLLVLG